jgi:galactokinase
VASLRDVDAVSELSAVQDPIDVRRARHVLTENQRVLDCVAVLGTSEFSAVGELWTESHASMRDDFEITTPHLDLIAAAAVQAGAFGARMNRGWLRWVRHRAAAGRAGVVGRRRGAAGGAGRGLPETGRHQD